MTFVKCTTRCASEASCRMTAWSNTCTSGRRRNGVKLFIMKTVISSMSNLWLKVTWTTPSLMRILRLSRPELICMPCREAVNYTANGYGKTVSCISTASSLPDRSWVTLLCSVPILLRYGQKLHHVPTSHWPHSTLCTSTLNGDRSLDHNVSDLMTASKWSLRKEWLSTTRKRSSMVLHWLPPWVICLLCIPDRSTYQRWHGLKS